MNDDVLFPVLFRSCSFVANKEMVVKCHFFALKLNKNFRCYQQETPPFASESAKCWQMVGFMRDTYGAAP
jgi:hypothetical protein